MQSSPPNDPEVADVPDSGRDPSPVSEPVASTQLDKHREFARAEPIPSIEFLQNQAGRFHATLRWGSRR